MSDEPDFSDEPNFTDEEIEEFTREINRKDLEDETNKNERYRIIENLIDKAESIQNIADDLEALGNVSAARKHWAEASVWFDAAETVDKQQFDLHPRLKYVKRFRGQ